MAYNLTRKQIEDIYNSAPMPEQTPQNAYQPSFNSGMSRDEIANIYNSYTPEIPKLEQNITPTPTNDYRAEIERMNKLKADTTAPRTEGENKAIDTYLNSLTDAQRYIDSTKPVTPSKNSESKVSKRPIGTVEIKADGTKKFTKAMSDREKKEYERNNRLNKAIVIGKQARENAQPKERALSANEQRDYERAQNAIAQAKKNDNPYKKLSDTAKKFTELPKKDKPRYDDRGFLINPSITENQGTVDEYLDPNKKLSPEDERKAWKLIDEYEKSELGEKNENALTLITDDEHPDGRMVPLYTVDENGVYQPSWELTPEERQYQQSIGELKTKVMDSESALVGAMQTVPFVDALGRAGDTDGSYARMVANAQKQNPLAYWGGLLGTGVAMNAAGQFALKGTKYGDLVNKVFGADKEGASVTRKVLADAAMDAPVDFATDIAPTFASDVAQGKSAGEVIGNTGLNIGLNSLFNIIPAVASNWSDLRFNNIPEVWTPQKNAAQNTVQSAVENVIPVVDDVVPQEAKVIENIKKAVNEIPEVVENPVEPKKIFNPDDMNAEEVLETVRRNSEIDVKSVKAANKQLDNNINSLVNMFGKQKNNEGVVALKEALNEYAETGSEEALTRARTIASNMDQYYSGASYKSKKGNITDFGNGANGTFSSQVNDFAEKLGANATIKGTPLHVTNLEKRVNDLFSKYDLSAEDAESVRAWKQAINDYMAEPTEDTWNALLNTSSDVARRSENLSEFVSSYKGKVKSNPFDRSELIGIMDEIDARRPMKNAPNVPDVEAPVNANNIPPANNVPPTPVNSAMPEKGSGPKKVSQYRTNSMEKTGLVNEENAPLSDFEYNVFGVDEQRKAGLERYKNSQDIPKDLRRKEVWDEVDARLAQDKWTELMQKGDKKSLEEAQKLYRRTQYELREGGRLIQVAAELDDSASQLNQAHREISRIVDQIEGSGTSEALDNLATKISNAYETSGTKEEFEQKLKNLLSRNLKEYAPTNKNMKAKTIKGVDEAVDKIRKAKSFEDMSFDEILDSIYKANGGSYVSAAEQKQIYDLLEQAKTYKPKSYKQEALLARAAKIAMAKAPSSVGDKVRSILYQNMLGNFKTAISRNAFGNLMYQGLEQSRQPIAAAYDQLVSLGTGQHTTRGWNKGKAVAYGKGFGKGIADQARDVRYHIDTGRSGEFGWANALKNNSSTWDGSKTLAEGYDENIVEGTRNALAKMANNSEYYVRNAMEFGDRPFYEANYAQSKEELEQLLAKYGKKGVAGFEAVPDENVDDVVDMISSVRAADSVFQKHGKMSEGLTKMRQGLSDISRGAVGVDILSTSASPFTMTPGNMVERAIEYSPLGLIKNTVETGKELAHGNFNQKRFVDELSRTTTGIPLLLGAYGLAKNGHITGGYSDDPDERAAQQDNGYIEYGLKIGDKIYDTSDIPVLGQFMQAGGAIAEKGVTPESLGQAIDAVTMGSAMQGFRKAFGADAGYSTSGSMLDNFVDTVKSSGTQLVPSLLRQTAQTTDKYKRDLGEYGTNQYYWNNILNSIPGLRETLPIKYDSEGNEVLQNQGRSLGDKIKENYFLPMNVSEYNPSELTKEASRLLEETGKADAFIQKAQRKDLRKWCEDNNIEYSEELFRDYKQDFGERNSAVGNKLIDSDYYQSLDADKQTKVLSDVWSGIKAYEKEKITGVETDDKIAKAYKDGKAKGVINYLEGKDIVSDSGASVTSKAANVIQSMFDSGDKEGARQLSDDVSYLRDEGLSTEQQGVYASRGSSFYDAEEYVKLYNAMNTDDKPSITQKEALSFLNKAFTKGTPQEQREALQVYESMVTDYKPGESNFVTYDSEKGQYVTVSPKKSKYTSSLVPEVEPVEEPSNQQEEWDKATLSDDPYTIIRESGVGQRNEHIDKAWDKAILADPSLTPQQFINEWSAIDTDKGGTHSQDEIVNHMNSAKMTQEEGEKFAAKYWHNNWKKKPKMNSEGKWYYS